MREQSNGGSYERIMHAAYHHWNASIHSHLKSHVTSSSQCISLVPGAVVTVPIPTPHETTPELQ